MPDGTRSFALLCIDPDAPTLGRVRSLVVTRGGAGVVALAADGAWVVPAHSVTVVDTTGAGDAFAGTLCAALARGATLFEACRAGSAAGAFAVTRPGASASYGTTAEVAALEAATFGAPPAGARNPDGEGGRS